MAKKSIARFFFWFLSLIYGGALIALYFGEYWPEKYWWIPNLILIGPLWVLIVPLVLFLYMGFRVNSIKGVYFHSLLIIVLTYFLLDFRVPLEKKDRLYGDPVTLRVVSLNVEGIAGASLYGYIKNVDANVVMLQELYDEDVAEIISQYFLRDGWEFLARRGLAIATKFPIVDTDYHEHYVMGAKLATDAGDLFVYNVHLETPREGVEALIRNGIIGRYGMQGATKVQSYESQTASALMPAAKNLVVAGDFNLTQANPIYRTYWGHLQNAFEASGKGFGYTKYTRWHGVRIDHILSDNNWRVLSADAGPDLGGDHRPVFAEFQKPISEEARVRNANPAPVPEKKVLPPQEDIFVYEDFEDTEVLIDISTDMSQAIKFKQNQGRSMKMEAGPLSIRSGSIKFPPEPFDAFPKISMTYQMLPDQPMVLRAKTQLGEWICLAVTSQDLCEHPAIPNLQTLYNDGQWHAIEIDVIKEIQTLLRGNKTIRELEMQIPPHDANLNKVWLDDVLNYR